MDDRVWTSGVFQLSRVIIRAEPGFQSQSEALSRLLERLTGLVRRQYLLIVIIIAFTTAIGGVYLMTTPAVYSAHAKLLIDSGKVRAAQQQMVPYNTYVPVDFSEIMTQVEVLKSDNIALSVIKNLHLTENPAFVGKTEQGRLQALFGPFDKPIWRRRRRAAGYKI